MPTLSLRKIAIAIAGFLILINLKKILRVFQPAYTWFAESLNGLNQFPKDAQTAIAFALVLLFVVLITKTLKKF